MAKAAIARSRAAAEPGPSGRRRWPGEPCTSTRPPSSAQSPICRRITSMVFERTASSSLVIESPVRSGQSVTFIEGDVTVLGSVGSGAEIVAGGSIHVYGTLRGRAIAGVNGNSSARIYCQRIDAELLAIDGYYQTAEELDANLRSKPVQARLDGKIIRITPLN